MISFVISDSDILETVEKAKFVEFFMTMLNVGWVRRRIEYIGQLYIGIGQIYKM